jgi:hypothetical protein
MNAAILTTLVALGLGATGAAAWAETTPALGTSPSCTDLAGQGSACTDIAVDPQNGTVAARSTVVIRPDPPVAEAAQACVDLAGQGEACQSGDASSGTVTYTVHNETLGVTASGYVAYRT